MDYTSCQKLLVSMRSKSRNGHNLTNSVCLYTIVRYSIEVKNISATCNNVRAHTERFSVCFFSFFGTFVFFQTHTSICHTDTNYLIRLTFLHLCWIHVEAIWSIHKFVSPREGANILYSDIQNELDKVTYRKFSHHHVMGICIVIYLWHKFYAGFGSCFHIFGMLSHPTTSASKVQNDEMKCLLFTCRFTVSMPSNERKICENVSIIYIYEYVNIFIWNIAIH